jgi:hypothetical protein
MIMKGRQGLGPQYLNHRLAEVFLASVQKITLGWDAFHPTGRNLWLHGGFLSVS